MKTAAINSPAAALWLLDLDLEALRRRSGDLSHFACASLVSIEDGPQRGARQVRMSNACGLSLEIEVDRACDIGRVQYNGVPIGWTSPSGLQHPAPSPEAENGLGLLRSFSGFLVTCGLDHIGAPSMADASNFGYPLRKHLTHPLHGRISAAPSRLLGWGVDWHAERPVLWCEALIRQAAVFGEALELRRRIEVDVIEPKISVCDVVRNVSFRPSTHQILYHVNIGYPLLSRNAKLHLETAVDRQVLGHHDPLDECSESVEQFSVRSDAGGWGHALLYSPDIGLAAHLAFDRSTLPGFARWCAGEPGMYVTGLEPHSMCQATDSAKSPTPDVLLPMQSISYRFAIRLLGDERTRDMLRGSG